MAVATIPRVLIADDDASSRALLDVTLRREGFEIIEATNGRDALARLGEQPIDIVLLDVDMPFLDGFRTLREIRANARFRTLPVILVTGSIDDAERIRGLEIGADDYIGKPIRIRELTARVKAQLRERHAWATEFEQNRQTRRNLNAALEDLSQTGSLLELASELVQRLPSTLGVEGAAILHFAGGSVHSLAASGALEDRFKPARPVEKTLEREMVARAVAGPWIETAEASTALDAWMVDVAFIPFRLGAGAPIGCLAYAVDRGTRGASIAHRLADLADATEQIVVVLRPAVERAETADASIARIRRVIAEREFRILLQPIVRLDDRAVVACEALTRFADEGSPQIKFEEAGALGLGGTLQRATAAAAIEASAGLPPDVALTVNLSAAVIEHEPGLAELFASTDRSLIVEVTEHERIDDYDAVRAALERLGPNIRLAIDDAGSGFASLRHIFALKPDFVKLDIEWVRRIDQDPVRRALVSGLVHFASETGCVLIAEGIETDEELAALQTLGVGLGQGYLLGRPAAPPA